MEKKSVMLYGVAVMENPYDRGRTSTGSSTIIRNSDVDMHLDSIDAIHNVHCHPAAFQDEFRDPVLTDIDHSLLESPHHSLAPTTATTTTTQKQKYRVLGTVSLVGIVYFATCGGPVGSEPLISAGGPLVGLLSIVAYVLLCQFPLSLMVTELCCAFPENGGYAVWAMTAFGPFWGFQVGYWSWIASVLNNAIYPGFIYATMSEAYGIEATSAVVEFFVKVLIAILLAVPSYVGVRFVGLGSLVLLVLVLLTTGIFTVWGFAESEHAWFRLSEVRSANETNIESTSGGIDWDLLIHALFWSFDGLYDVSVIGGEVINPARTYPRVIVAAVLLAVLTYLLPWISAVSADKMPWIEFTEDSLPNVADAIGGSVLHQFALTSSVLSSIAMFSCTLFFQSFLVQGMAQSRLLPGLLRRRNARFRTPQYAILLSLITTLCLLGFDFESILNMTNAFSGFVQLSIVMSMLQLRRSFPYLPRPMKVPGNFTTLVIMLLPATAVFIFAIITTFAELKLALVVIGLAIPGFAFPMVRRSLAGRRACC